MDRAPLTLALACAIAACAGGSKDGRGPIRPPAIVVPIASATASSDAGVDVLDSPESVPKLVDDGYAALAKGNATAARALFRRAVLALESRPAAAQTDGGAPPPIDRGAGPGTSVVERSPGGRLLVAETHEGLFVADPRTGTPRGRIHDGTYSHDFAMDDRIVTSGDFVTVYEPERLERVVRLESANMVAAYSDDRGTLAVLVPPPKEGDPHPFHVVDLRTRAETIVKGVDDPDTNVQQIALDDGGRLLYVITSGQSPRVYAIDVPTGRRIGSRTASFLPSLPAASADGKLVAIPDQTMDDKGYAGSVALFERATGKLLGTSNACPAAMSVGFSGNGKLLAIGDLRKACIVHVPSMRLAGRTAELRPGFGPDDDLQNVFIDGFFASDRALMAQTADGTISIFRPQGGAALWSGRGAARVDKAGVARVVDRDTTRTLITFGADLKPTARPLTDEEASYDEPVREVEDTRPARLSKSALDTGSCHVGDWIFPAGMCE